MKGEASLQCPRHGPPYTLILPLTGLIIFFICLFYSFKEDGYINDEYLTHARLAFISSLFSLVIPLLEFLCTSPGLLSPLNKKAHVILAFVYLFPYVVIMGVYMVILLSIFILWVVKGTLEFDDSLLREMGSAPTKCVMLLSFVGASLHGILVLLLPRELVSKKQKTDEEQQPQEEHLTNGYTSMGG